MKTKLLFLITILCFGIHSLSAQVAYSLGDEAAYIQKLEKEAEQENNDSTKASAYFRISTLYKRAGNIEEAKRFLELAKKTKTDSDFLNAASTYYETMISLNPADLISLEKNLMKSDSVLTPFDHPEAYKIRALCWILYGTIQQIKSSESGAMEAFTNKAATLATKSGDPVAIGKANKSIAIIFMNANQREKASSYLTASVNAMEKIIPPLTPLQRVEMVETYIVTAENQVALGHYDSAKTLIDKAKGFLAPYPSSNLHLIFYPTEGGYYEKMQLYPQADESFKKGIAFAENLKEERYLNRMKFAYYKMLKNQKNFQKAAAVMEDLIQSPLVFTTDKKIYYGEIYKTYMQLGNQKQAFRWAEKYITISDSLYESKFQKDIIELEKKYKEAENREVISKLKAEKEKETIEARNTRNISILLGALSLCLIFAIILGIRLYLNRRKFAQQQELYYQRELLDAQQKQEIQVTKALMQGEEKERQRLAIDLHDGLGARLAGVKISLSQLTTSSPSNDQELTKVMEQLDVSSNELRRIARNLMPETLLRLGIEPALKDLCDALSTEEMPIEFQAFGIQKEIAQSIQMNIYRIVQELLTNAVRHAQASQILLQCSQNESMFLITLEDNGKGFEVNKSTEKSGIGLNNIRKRVEYLNGKLEISSSPKEGTTVNIEFNVTA